MEKGNIFKPTIGNESLHQDSNDKGTRRVNFTTSRNLDVKAGQVVSMRERRGVYMGLVE